MPTELFINLPVKDLKRSIDFFTKLGFQFNSQFTDDKGTCMIVNDGAFVMLLAEEFFQTFITKPVASAKSSAEVILSYSIESREAVDQKVNMAVSLGATTPNKPSDYGWMYQWGFQDIDGHLWEVFYMDKSAIPSMENTGK